MRRAALGLSKVNCQTEFPLQPRIQIAYREECWRGLSPQGTPQRGHHHTLYAPCKQRRAVPLALKHWLNPYSRQVLVCIRRMRGAYLLQYSEHLSLQLTGHAFLDDSTKRLFVRTDAGR